MSPVVQRLMYTLLPVLLIGAVFVSTLWGEHGVMARHRLRARLADANAELASIERENQRLILELKGMDRDPVVLERAIADEIAWGQAGAVIYRFER
jgi:cell division protein FtsB